MQFRHLQCGDVFVEMSAEEWDAMSPADRKRQRRITLDHSIGVCRTTYDRVHVKTSTGDWCISLEAPVVRLAQAGAKPAGKVA